MPQIPVGDQIIVPTWEQELTPLRTFIENSFPGPKKKLHTNTNSMKV